MIVSYNNEGIISEEELVSIMKENSIDNKVVIEKIPYRKYKSKRASNSYDLYEILLYIRKKEMKTANTHSTKKKLSLKKNGK